MTDKTSNSSIRIFDEHHEEPIHPGINILNWLEEVVKTENKTVQNINFIFCSDEDLWKLNIDYLNHDDYTDVISFPYSADPLEGDIYISIDRVRENAEKFNVTFKNELYRVMVHGLLHFLGYKDKTKEEAEVMRNKENEYLKKLDAST